MTITQLRFAQHTQVNCWNDVEYRYLAAKDAEDRYFPLMDGPGFDDDHATALLERRMDLEEQLMLTRSSSTAAFGRKILIAYSDEREGPTSWTDIIVREAQQLLVQSDAGL